MSTSPMEASGLQSGSGANASRRGAPGLEREIRDHIGLQLRAVYNEVLNEPIPDRFKQLLDELERKQAKGL